MKSKSAKVLLALVAILFGVWGCSQFADTIPATKGRTLTHVDIFNHFIGKPVLFGDVSYTEVNPEFAEKWHDYTRKVMSVLGMASNWTEQFDCNRFTNIKLAVIHIRFLVDTWHNRNPSNAPAAGEIWYFVNGNPNTRHSTIVTIENGQKVYRDIYSSKKLFLSPAEERSIYLIKF